MLSKDMVTRLNEQINIEAFSSNLYLQMAAWCETHALRGSAFFLGKHAGEEAAHMRKIFDYVSESGQLAVLGTIQAPPVTFANLDELFSRILEHEREVTVRINAIVEAALTEKDYATFNFLQWFVAEQREEERLVEEIVDKIKLVGGDGRGLFFLDREIASIAARA